jgi:cyclohexa-1,5-dienecarbonyl-CoA hydratase
MSGNHVRLERDGVLARITLDRPPLNVLDLAMTHELADALDEAAGASVLLLTGAGRAFCAGVDVADHIGERARPMLAGFHAVIRKMLAFEGPVLAAVNGAALGGGCELLLAADVVIAREDARLGQPEIRLGVFPPVAVALLPGLAGRQRALDLILSGRTLPATEALGLGLVNRVVPADRLQEEAAAYAHGLAALSPAVLRLTKRAVTGAALAAAIAAIDAAEQTYLAELMKLEDANEGLVAFLEKRAPVWRNG